MKCFTCKNPITRENRADYKFGLRLPYCKNCVQAYILAKKFGAMSEAQKERFIKDVQSKLHNTEYTTEQLEEAKEQLRAAGLTDDQIKAMTKTLHNSHKEKD